MFQANFNTKQFEKHQHKIANYQTQLTLSQIWGKYLWMEHKLASVRTSARHANEVVRKNRISLKLPPLDIIDHNGFLKMDKILEHQLDSKNCLKEWETRKRINKFPRIAFNLAFVGMVFLLAGAISGQFK